MCRVSCTSSGVTGTTVDIDGSRSPPMSVFDAWSVLRGVAEGWQRRRANTSFASARGRSEEHLCGTVPRRAHLRGPSHNRVPRWSIAAKRPISQYRISRHRKVGSRCGAKTWGRTSSSGHHVCNIRLNRKSLARRIALISSPNCYRSQPRAFSPRQDFTR